MAIRALAKITAAIFFLVFAVALASAASEISLLCAKKIYKNTALADLNNKVSYLRYMNEFWRWKNGEAKEVTGDLWMRYAASKQVDYINATQAVSAYREAINAMPANALLLIKFVLAKSRVQEFDHEFYFAFRKAVEYGGSEIEINENIFYIGMINVGLLNAEALLSVKESTRRLYPVKGYLLLQDAKKYGQLHMVCLWISDLVAPNTACQKEL